MKFKAKSQDRNSQLTFDRASALHPISMTLAGTHTGNCQLDTRAFLTLLAGMMTHKFDSGHIIKCTPHQTERKYEMEIQTNESAILFNIHPAMVEELFFI